MITISSIIARVKRGAFEKKSNGNGVRLCETITLKEPDMLFGYAFRQVQAAHEEMPKLINVFVEINKR